MQSTIANELVFERTNVQTVGGAGNAAVVTLTATDGVKYAIDQVTWSYNAVPTNGLLTIADVDTAANILTVAIVDSGPGVVYFPRSFVGTAGSVVTITLAAPGGGVVGIVNVQYH